MSETVEAEVISERKEQPRQVLVPNVKAIETVLLTDEYVKNVERQIELRRKLLMTIVKATREHDWIDFDGKPYLEGEGAYSGMAAVRGFVIRETVYSEEFTEGHYFLEALTPMEWMGQSTVGYGDCNTADSFFTGRDGKGGKLAKETERTGSHDIAVRIVKEDAKKKARENSISRGFMELTGLKGVTWGDLEELGYTPKGAGAKVEFKKGSQGGDTGTITILQALQAPKGSVFNLRGQIANVQERTPKTRTLTDYQLIEAGDDETIKVTVWGNAVPGAVKGAWLYCDRVAVDEYQGRPQFQAKAVSIVEIQVPAPSEQPDPLMSDKPNNKQGELL